MDYIWLWEPVEFDQGARVTWDECYGKSVRRLPDVSAPVEILSRANSQPTILKPGLFPMGFTDMERYLEKSGAFNAKPRGYHVEALKSLSTIPVPVEDPLERSWKYKGGGTRAEWKKAQEKGSILIRPLYTGSYVLTDVLVPKDGAARLARFDASQTGLLEDAPLVMECTFGQRLRKAPGFPIDYVVHGESQAFYRAFGAMAGRYDASDVTSLFRLHAPPIELFVTYLENQEHPSGLVNPTLEKLNAGVYDLLTEFAELTSTVEYIYSALRRIILAFIGIKSREVIAAKKYGYGTKEFIDELAGLWMSFRYAASPLAYSIQDAQKVLAAQQKVFTTERGRKDVPFQFEADGYTFSGNIEWRCFAKAKVEGATVGLGLNPIRTLWEITPLAFVVGWVLPVGSMLSALMPPSGATQTVASLSYRVRNVTITTKRNGRTVTVPNKIDIYKVTPIEPSAEFDLWPQVHMNWMRSLDGMALSWSMFLKQFWKSKK